MERLFSKILAVSPALSLSLSNKRISVGGVSVTIVLLFASSSFVPVEASDDTSVVGGSAMGI